MIRELRRKTTQRKDLNGSDTLVFFSPLLNFARKKEEERVNCMKKEKEEIREKESSDERSKRRSFETEKLARHALIHLIWSQSF